MGKSFKSSTMPTYNTVDMMDCANGVHSYDNGGEVGDECTVCGHVAEDDDSAEADRRKVAILLSHIRAIRARIKGEWDNPDLLAMGPLFTSWTDDVLRLTDAAITAAEGNAPEPEPAPKFVYVLTIDSGRGTITSAFESEDEAQADLAKWCRECWPWPDTNPADLQDHEVIAEYFDGNDDEFATIERIQVGG